MYLICMWSLLTFLYPSPRDTESSTDRSEEFEGYFTGEMIVVFKYIYWLFFSYLVFVCVVCVILKVIDRLRCPYPKQQVYLVPKLFEVGPAIVQFSGLHEAV